MADETDPTLAVKQQLLQTIDDIIKDRWPEAGDDERTLLLRERTRIANLFGLDQAS
jgi:hypothetical protein